MNRAVAAALLSLLFLSFATVKAQAITRNFALDTSLYAFKLDNGSIIRFSASRIHFDGFSWIGTDTLKFYNLKITETDNIPEQFSITIQNGNITFQTLFDNSVIEAYVYGATETLSTVIISTGSYGKPRHLAVDLSYYAEATSKTDFDSSTSTSWYYDTSENKVYIKILHHSPTHLLIDWKTTQGGLLCRLCPGQRR